MLADVPCSGTGTLARNPEIKWRLKPEDLDDLHARQLAILRGAMDSAAAGGRVIYSTCSLEIEENENVVEQALADDNSFRLLDCRVEIERLQGEGEMVWSDAARSLADPICGRFPACIPAMDFLRQSSKSSSHRFSTDLRGLVRNLWVEDTLRFLRNNLQRTSKLTIAPATTFCPAAGVCETMMLAGVGCGGGTDGKGIPALEMARIPGRGRRGATTIVPILLGRALKEQAFRRVHRQDLRRMPKNWLVTLSHHLPELGPR